MMRATMTGENTAEKKQQSYFGVSVMIDISTIKYDANWSAEGNKVYAEINGKRKKICEVENILFRKSEQNRIAKHIANEQEGDILLESEALANVIESDGLSSILSHLQKYSAYNLLPDEAKNKILVQIIKLVLF